MSSGTPGGAASKSIEIVPSKVFRMKEISMGSFPRRRINVSVGSVVASAVGMRHLDPVLSDITKQSEEVPSEIGVDALK